MPLKTPKRRVSEPENKLRLLCCMEALGSVTQVQLWPFVARLDLMEYMPMQLLLHELIAEGELEAGTHALDDQLCLSDKGRETLRLFEGRVLPGDRERIRAAAPAYRTELLQRSQVRALYESAEPGSFRVLLELRETEIPTLSLRLFTTQRALAAQAIQAFPAKAPALLTELYALVAAASEPDPRSPAGDGPEAEARLPFPALEAHSLNEHTVTAELCYDPLQMTLSLLFADYETANACGQTLSHPQTAKKAAQCVATLLCGL